ncbi:MAG: polyprenyl synthetase family protein [Halobacteriota archaeon]|jgi:octaprenyl-diphosphate synthase
MQRSPRNTSSDSFLTRIDFYRAQVDLALQKELRQRQESPFFAPFVDAFAGGKRLRPIIVLLAYNSVGGRAGDPLPAAVAVELAHMESLIHDDIIDGDGIRRKAKAFHAVHGQEMALLSADFILSMILSITARYEDPRITSALAEATAIMCEGELTERFIYRTKKVRPGVYQEMVSKKTASLFEAAATLGALIGGGTPRDVRTLATYAHALGVAYQVCDDIIDWSQSRPIMLDLDEISCSQDEYLQEIAATKVNEAIESLQHLKSSEARKDLTQMAKCVELNQIDRI